MIIELKTKYHTEYVHETVTFEDAGEYVEIKSDGYHVLVKKSELRKVLTVMCED
jgi:hypothetical protein